MFSRLPFRIRASLIHLGCCMLVAAVALSLIFPVWHPGAIAALQGINRLVIVMIAVDVVLGPVTTLITFNPRKPTRLLKLDLAIILSLQVAALAYGLLTIFLARPVYIVFNVDRFTIVTAKEIVSESLRRTEDPAFQHLPLGRPKLVAARLPDDPQAHAELVFATLEGGPDIYQHPEYFVDYELQREQVIRHLSPLSELRSRNDLDNAAWAAFLSDFDFNVSELGYLPVEANSREGAAIIHRSSGNFISLVELYPDWG